VKVLALTTAMHHCFYLIIFKGEKQRCIAKRYRQCAKRILCIDSYEVIFKIYPSNYFSIYILNNTFCSFKINPILDN
jgi:hypothetical protein